MSDERQDELREAVGQYFTGHATGDPEVMGRAFHPDARLQWIKEGAYSTCSVEEYLRWLPGSPAEDEERRRRRIVSLSAAGDTATAEVELDYPAMRFVDYLTLLRVDGGWTIVNKVFQAFPKEAS